MKNFFTVVLALFLNFSFIFENILAKNPEFNIDVVSIATEDYKKISCSLEIWAEKDWHPAKKPEIILESSKNIQDFSYDDSGDCKKIGNQTWKIDFSFTKNENFKKSSADLIIHVPLCSDICTIVTKKIKISDIGLMNDIPNKIMYPKESSKKSKEAEQKLIDSIINDGNFETSSLPIHAAPFFSKYFVWILLMAFLGGCILNFMPCVLPVLLLKLRTFTYIGKNYRRALLGTLLGNYFIFFIFASVVYFFKASGEIIGWGMHFQNITFLKVIAVILFLLLLYSEELITFSPSFEIKNESKRVIFGNFIASIVTAVMAIPCTAPFLGIAATFAMIQATTIQLFMIFMMIATGFSSPYFLTLVIPKIFTNKISISPKISHWIGVIFKKFVSFGISIALFWIIYFINRHSDYLLKTLVPYIFIFAFILFRESFTKTAMLLLCTIFLIPLEEYPNHKKNMNEFSKENIEIEKITSRENIFKNIVVLNITADWCMTCQFNKIHVLNTLEIQNEFKKNNVIFVEADMTKKNDNYMNFIRKHNRVGIPFTMVFGPATPEGILLPEVFSKQELLNAIAQASES